MGIHNISAKASSFIHHKPFHPASKKNVEKLYEAEQNAQTRKLNCEARRKAAEKEFQLLSLASCCSASNNLTWVAEKDDKDADALDQQNHPGASAADASAAIKFLERSATRRTNLEDLKLKSLLDPALVIRKLKRLKALKNKDYKEAAKVAPKRSREVAADAIEKRVIMRNILDVRKGFATHGAKTS